MREGEEDRGRDTGQYLLSMCVERKEEKKKEGETA